MTSCPEQVNVNNDSTGWLGRSVTPDELAVAEWLRTQKGFSRLLHVGIGNCFLSDVFGDRVQLGLTKDGGEADAARHRQFKIVVCNKYALASW